MTKWTVDQAHSTVGFEVKHMMVSKVRGQFTSYTAVFCNEKIHSIATATTQCCNLTWSLCEHEL